MIDRIVFATLTFSLLITGSMAIGAALFGAEARSSSVAARAASTPVRIVEFERVVITGKRALPVTDVARSEPGEAVTQRLE